MSKLRIFIEGSELDTLQSVSVPITRQYEELSDPTVICNDYSKTITVPLSANNNAIFGHAYRPDRLISAGSEDTPLVGVYFDPYKRLQCRVQWGDDIVLSGFAKMLRVSSNGYELTINGELGRLFQEMKKITFDETKYSGSEKTAYWIDGSKYVNCDLNKDLVAASWRKAPSSISGELREVGDEGYNVHDIIGFTPNNAIVDGFTASSYGDTEEHTFEDLLTSFDFESGGLSAASVVGDGFKPREVGEFRAVNQIPHIYWDKFCKIFAKKVQSVTGYTLDLTNICNSNNHLAMRLKTQEQEVLEMNENVYHFTTISNTYSGSSGFATSRSGALVLNADSQQINILNTTTNALEMKTRTGLMKIDIPVVLGVQGPSTTPTAIAKGDYIKIAITVASNVYTFYIVSSDSTVTIPGGVTKVVMDNFTGSASGGWWSYPHLTFYTRQYGTDVSFRYSIVYGVDTYPWRDSGDHLGYSTYTHLRYNTNETQVQCMVKGSLQLHNITLNDLWDNDYQPFDMLLTYCKVHRLRFVVDELAKTIKVAPFVASADDFSIVDMSERLDVSKGFDVEPVTMSSHYIRLNAENSDTTNASDYNATTGLSYGDKRLTTQYNFDTTEQELFSGYKTDILYTPYVSSLAQILNNKRVLYVLPSEVYVDAESDGKYVDNFGSLYFITRGLFDTDSNLTSVSVSDASVFQEMNQQYFYVRISNTAYTTASRYYLKPNHYYSTQLELLGKPAKNYTYLTSYFSGYKDLYTIKWQSYLNERYNVQNKRVTCYVRMLPHEFMAFDFRQLWRIGNTLYMVNKIYDYDVTSDEPTKVELITIQDINGYL